MPRSQKPAYRSVVVNAMCAPAVKGKTTRSTSTVAPPPPPPPPLTRRAKHALNDLTNNPTRRAIDNTEDAIVQPVRRSTRIMALQQQHNDSKNTTDDAKASPNRHGTAATRSDALSVMALTAEEPRLRRSSRFQAQQHQDILRRDSLQNLGDFTDPKSQLVRRKSARTASTAPLTNDAISNGNRHSIGTVRSSASSSKRQKISANGSDVDCFALPNGVPGTTESGIPPLDQRHIGNVFQVPEYASQIYQYLYIMETRFSVNSYTKTHLYLREVDRFDAIDWLLKLATAYKCEEPVVYLSIQILDRYLSGVSVQIDDLQMVAAVTLMLASKYEEVEALTVAHLLMVINHDTASEVVETERLILEHIHYEISGPTSWSFLQRFLIVTNPHITTQQLARYLLECTLYVEELLNYRPSEVAATIVCLAVRNPLVHDTDGVEMQDALLAYTHFELPLLIEIAEILEDSILVPSAAEKEGFRYLRRKKEITIKDQTEGYAAWIKFSRHEHRKVSSRFPPPMAWHIAGDSIDGSSSENDSNL